MSQLNVNETICISLFPLLVSPSSSIKNYGLEECCPSSTFLNEGSPVGFTFSAYSPVFDAGCSSTKIQCIQSKSETYEEEFGSESPLDEMVEHEVYMRMPPRKSYTVKITVKERKRGEPKLVLEC